MNSLPVIGKSNCAVESFGCIGGAPVAPVALVGSAQLCSPTGAYDFTHPVPTNYQIHHPRHTPRLRLYSFFATLNWCPGFRAARMSVMNPRATTLNAPIFRSFVGVSPMKPRSAWRRVVSEA